MALSSATTLSAKFRIAKDVRKPAECVFVVAVITEWTVGKITAGTRRSTRQQGVCEMAAYIYLSLVLAVILPPTQALGGAHTRNSLKFRKVGCYDCILGRIDLLPFIRRFSSRSRENTTGNNKLAANPAQWTSL